MSAEREEELPVAVWEGEFTICGVTLKCATLSTGQRVIDADDMAALFAAMDATDAPALASPSVRRV